MSCITYINNNPNIPQMQISGTSCGGTIVNYIVSYGQTVCMDASKPLINLNGLQISGSCLPVTPTPSPTNSYYCFTSGLTYQVSTYQCPNNGVDYLDQYGIIRVDIFKNSQASGDHPDYTFNVTNGTQIDYFQVLRGQTFNEFYYPKLDFRYTDTGCTTTTLPDWYITSSNIASCGSVTPTPTPTQTSTNTPTNTLTPSVTVTNTLTPSVTVTPSQTPTNTLTPTQTPTNTPSNTPTQTPTNTPTQTPTNTVTPSITPTCQEQSRYAIGDAASSGDYIYSLNTTSWLAGADLAGVGALYYFSPNSDGTKWIATSGDRIYYSTNLTSWTLTLSSTTTLFNSTYWDGNKFIVPANDRVIHESTDGQSWSANTSFTGNSVSPRFIQWDGTTYVLQSSTQLWSSTDLNTWTLRHSSNNMQGLDYYQNKFWVGRTSSRTVESYDGINWTANTFTNIGNITTFAYDGTSMVMGAIPVDASATTYLWYSTNSGTSWNSATTPILSAQSIDVKCMMHNGTKFMAVVSGRSGFPGQGRAYDSTDGQTWTEITGATTFGAVRFLTIGGFPQPFFYPQLLQCDYAPPVTPNPTQTATPSQTPSQTPTNTPTNSVTPSQTPTNTITPSITPTNTVTPSVTPSNTPTNSVTPSVTPSNTQTPTNTVTPTTSTITGYFYNMKDWFNCSSGGNFTVRTTSPLLTGRFYCIGGTKASVISTTTPNTNTYTVGASSTVCSGLVC